MTEKIPKNPLNEHSPDLHKSEEVNQAADYLNQNGARIPNQPSAKINAYVELLGDEDYVNLGVLTGDKDALERQKEYLHKHALTGIDDEYITKKLRRDAQIAQDQGHGLVDEIMARLSDEVRAETRAVIVKDQTESLDRWVDYLSSQDAMYPNWFKHLAFEGVLKMSTFNKQKKEFTKRSADTTNPFPELNAEALAYVYDSLIEHYGLTSQNSDSEIDPELKRRIENNSNFAKLYGRSYDRSMQRSLEVDQSTEGEWVKYDQTEDEAVAHRLSKSVDGTGWCTGGQGVAGEQLRAGDFYVYYTADKDGNYTLPRLAIRTESGSIAEVRGIAADQGVEDGFLDIVSEKMHQVDPEGARQYEQKVQDMKLLTKIYKKHQDDQELSRDELEFLYEIRKLIQSFNQFGKDKRIALIKQKRKQVDDLNLVFKDVKHLESGLSLGDLTSAEGLKLPDKIGGDLKLADLSSAEGLKLPNEIGGDLFLNSLTSAEGLKLPDKIGGSLWLDNLTSAEGLNLPDKIGGDLNLKSLTYAEGLKLPNEIGGSLWLDNLTSAEGLKLPNEIGGDLWLGNLTSAEGLNLPNEIGGDLWLDYLTSAEGLKLPNEIGGFLDLSSLTSAEGLNLPDKIGGDLNLKSLTSAEGLNLPDKIGGDLKLADLSSAEGLKLPNEIGGFLDLSSLTSAEGLNLPNEIGGDLWLGNLTSAEGLNLPNEIGGDLWLDYLTSAEGLKLPNEIGGSLWLGNLTPDEYEQLRGKYPNTYIKDVFHNLA